MSPKHPTPRARASKRPAPLTTMRDLTRAQAILTRERRARLEACRLRGLSTRAREALELLDTALKDGGVTAHIDFRHPERDVRAHGVLLQVGAFPNETVVVDELRCARALLGELSKDPLLPAVRGGRYCYIDPATVSVYNALLAYVVALEADQKEKAS
jgi:hypothetical protein